jgi:hypothetical protein
MLPSVQPLTELLLGTTWVYITPIRGWPERREVLRRIVVMYTRNHYLSPYAGNVWSIAEQVPLACAELIESPKVVLSTKF